MKLRHIFPALSVLAVVALAAAAQDRLDPKEVIKKAIQAEGRSSSLFKGTYKTVSSGIAYKGDVKIETEVVEWISPSGHFKMEVKTKVKNQVARVVTAGDGKEKGWRTINGFLVKLSEEELKQHIEDRQEADRIRLNRLLTLVDAKITAHTEEGMVVITVISHQSEQKLYLDKTSLLTAKSVTRSLKPNGDGSVYEFHYSDYREVDGSKFPFGLVAILDGKKQVELKVQSVEPVAGAPEAIFAEPPPPLPKETSKKGTRFD